MPRQRWPVIQSAADRPPTNALQIVVDVNVDVSTLADWPPEAARAFLLGVAQVLAAHNV